ncbi:MAG: class I tRNA ligase family protein [Candidatus Paceibacterota bacterium]
MKKAKQEYDPSKIETKWQKKWSKSKIYKSKEDSEKEKFYALDMFPYPSGEGLHVGHPKGFIATDIVSRFERMNGKNVLHPMGFDAFGLPAENYALKTKTNPADSVQKNVDRYKGQLEILGFDYDWSREVNTTDPKYYKWTQWIFIEMWKKGLAYESYEPINWCPSCKTGLANEDVENGRCERCGTPVEKKPMRQWVLGITKYADRLLTDLDATEQYVRPKVVDRVNPHKPGKPLVERTVAHAIVYDPKNKKYLIIRNKKFGWDTVIIGGIEQGEDVVTTARREVREETGYDDIEFVKILGGQTEAHYYTKHKGENRIAYANAVLFELKSDRRIPIADGEDKDNEILWVDKEDFVPGKMVNSELPVWLERLNDPRKADVKPFLYWPEAIKESQRNWIGRSEGALIKFSGYGKDIEIFTTRPDTIFGVTYVVLAPEHPLVTQFMGEISNKDEVEKYINRAKNETEIERTDAKKEKTGVELKGIKVINPANKEEVPVWIADYVLPDYGTGAVMAVPDLDERDGEFAKKFNLPIKNTEVKEYNGGTKVVKYKLRDWVFSRQRYWGEPIPLIHCEKCGVVAVPEKDLPVVLPKVKSYEPTGTGESPLAAIEKWVNVKCPTCKGKAKRETNTMPQWAGSSWYYLRYMDPKNKKKLVDPKKEKFWAPVDLYVGGAEHATRHLIYARFWHKFLYDIGVVTTLEPFTKLQNVGLIMGEDGRKMSKRFGNVVNPDEIVKTYGADTLRVYEMFMGPFDQQISWSTASMIGSRRFIERVWKLSEKIGKSDPLADRIIHKTIKKVTADIQNLRFNTAISALMIATNELEKMEAISKEHFEIILKLLAPFAPHITEEVWSSVLKNKKSIHVSDWPHFDPSLVVEDEINMVVQVGGRVRASFRIAPGESEEKIKETALALPEVKKWIGDSAIKKVIVVKGKLVSVVL